MIRAALLLPMAIKHTVPDGKMEAIRAGERAMHILIKADFIYGAAFPFTMFQNRKEAGRMLAGMLSRCRKKKNTLVLGIPRGGVAVAAELARKLGLPLDILVVKKIGFPGNEELAIGAVGLKEQYINEEFRQHPLVSREHFQQEVRQKRLEVKERYAALLGGKKRKPVKGKIVIIVDDGLATGATMVLALQILRKEKPAKIIVAVPVAPPETVQKLASMADEVVCAEQPAFFQAIGEFYKDFRQVEEKEAKRLLRKN